MTENIKTLFTAEEIKSCIKKLSAQIEEDYTGKDFTVILVSNGALIFGCDLIRDVSIPLHLDTISASSYRGSESTGQVDLRAGLKLCVKKRHVLIVDDILDTGRTLNFIVEKIQEENPLSLKTCVLLDKPSRRTVDISADYTGFEIEDHFVIGYGLDYDEHYRNLPYIGVMGE